MVTDASAAIIIKPNPMPSQNETLITLLRDVHQSCLTKFQALQNTATAGSDQFLATQDRIAQLESDFKDEALWAHPVDYNNHELLQAIVAVKMAPEEDPVNFFAKADHLIDYLTEHILSKIQDFSTNADTSVWNQKMLDELMKMRRALRNTKNNLIQAGEELGNDTAFVNLEDTFTTLLVAYRKHLRENSVQSNEDNIRLMQLLVELVKTAATVADFKTTYQTLNDYVKSQLPAPKNEET